MSTCRSLRALLLRRDMRKCDPYAHVFTRMGHFIAAYGACDQEKVDCRGDATKIKYLACAVRYSMQLPIQLRQRRNCMCRIPSKHKGNKVSQGLFHPVVCHEFAHILSRGHLRVDGLQITHFWRWYGSMTQAQVHLCSGRSRIRDKRCVRS